MKEIEERNRYKFMAQKSVDKRNRERNKSVIHQSNHLSRDMIKDIAKQIKVTIESNKLAHQ